MVKSSCNAIGGKTNPKCESPMTRAVHMTRKTAAFPHKPSTFKDFYQIKIAVFFAYISDLRKYTITIIAAF